MWKAIAVRRAVAPPIDGEAPIGRSVLQHDERHLRRRTIALVDGRTVLVDLPEPTVLTAGDALIIAGGGVIGIAAAAEPLYAIHGRNATHVTELVWHIGNRHLAAAIKGDQILILRDQVIKAMLERLGARVEEIVAEFNPVRGAYSGHGSHEHHHSGHEHHSHPHSDHH
ncbi:MULTISPECIES: urease accessory protein UreE [unclassified Beijerinckia]|uniref:urease accessory protein UreE n=1 Tax=unclassified Beijerinckia TaxID=2638183 RepID=UPI000896E2C8|nr:MULTISPECIES: urease accessory protein UreE [unclassified Beijerinckia]MDH7798874.1 urease accessory protein [Beijerinckia sp. GAS462]SED88312.1 urease accessory protein [Beijerinckia sp. 28-YEA-48]